MTETVLDPRLIIAWLRARSLARNLPAAVADSGGQLVETGPADETRRHVFTASSEGLRRLGERIIEQRHFLTRQRRLTS